MSINLTLQQILDREFDPTDADKCARLASEALKMCRLMLRAVQANEANLKLGRDLSRDMSVKVMDVAKILGLLNYNFSGGEWMEFVKEVTK